LKKETLGFSRSNQHKRSQKWGKSDQRKKALGEAGTEGPSKAELVTVAEIQTKVNQKRKGIKKLGFTFGQRRYTTQKDGLEKEYAGRR